MIEAHFTQTPEQQCRIQKSLANIISSDKTLEAFFQATNARIPSATQHSIGGTKQCTMTRKINKNKQIRRNKYHRTVSVSRMMCLSQKNPK